MCCGVWSVTCHSNDTASEEEEGSSTGSSDHPSSSNVKRNAPHRSASHGAGDSSDDALSEGEVGFGHTQLSTQEEEGAHYACVHACAAYAECVICVAC